MHDRNALASIRHQRVERSRRRIRFSTIAVDHRGAARRPGGEELDRTCGISRGACENKRSECGAAIEGLMEKEKARPVRLSAPRRFFGSAADTVMAQGRFAYTIGKKPGQEFADIAWMRSLSFSLRRRPIARPRSTRAAYLALPLRPMYPHIG